MTNYALEKANEIKNQLSSFHKLRRAAFKPYLKFWLLKIGWNGLALQDESDILICDEGLRKVIEEYCDTRIEELEAELESL